MITKYRTILADPPWRYDDPKANDPSLGGITYPTLSLAELKSLPVGSIAASDSALFMWATMPMLAEALELITAWGFTYRTCAFVWLKQNRCSDDRQPMLFYPGDKAALSVYSGLGHWTNGNAELCLFAKRGTPKRQDKSVKQIVIAPVSRHSAKPPEVRERIVRMMGDGPRIELFARERAEGWDVFGNEVQSDVVFG